MSTVSNTVTPAVPVEKSTAPTIELLGQVDAGGCCGGGSCGI
ncbi:MULTISPECIES: hypothetical protein [Cryobacterium]|nr:MULTISPECIES: hypothetical protein [Cryobacterium]